MTISTTHDLNRAANTLAGIASALRIIAQAEGAERVESALDGVAASINTVAEDLADALEAGRITTKGAGA